jgi:hypothetical protein
MAGRKSFEGKVFDGGADEAEGGQADRGGHAANLAVAPLGEGEREPGSGDGGADTNGGRSRGEGGVGDLDDFGGAGTVALDGDAGTESVEGGFGGSAFDLDAVGTAVGEIGEEEAELEGAVVGEEEQSFAIGVKAAGGVDVGDWDEVGEGGARRDGSICELGENAVGFVEEDVAQREGSGAPGAAPLE